MAIDIYSLPIASNVCQQELREVITLKNFSLAHVIMQPYAESLLHSHHHMTEIYYILEGNGILTVGIESFKAVPGNYFIVPEKTPHMLTNLSNKLEHLVIAIPPFDSTDVHLHERSGILEIKEPTINSRRTQALDNVIVDELMSEQERASAGIGIARGYLEPGTRSKAHRHDVSDELYLITKGKGIAFIDGQSHEMKKGFIVYARRGVARYFFNNADAEMELLAITTPPYSEKGLVID